MKTTFKNIIISAKNLGLHLPKWDNAKETVYKYLVTVENNAARISFDFYTSIKDKQDGIKEMAAKDLKFALYCFLQDARGGQMLFKEFAQEFGYNEDSLSAFRIHNACKLSAKKFELLNLSAAQKRAIEKLQ